MNSFQQICGSETLFCPLTPPPQLPSTLFPPPAWFLVSLKDTFLLFSISKMGHKSELTCDTAALSWHRGWGERRKMKEGWRERWTGEDQVILTMNNIHTADNVSKILKIVAFSSPPSGRSCNLSSGNLIIPNFGSWKNRDVPQQIRTYLIKPEA